MRIIPPKPDLVAQVQTALIDAIVNGELAPGDRLQQEELAARLGVSRQPVLQALRLLREQGLIVTTPNRRGLRVAPLDTAFIRSLYELRSALDGAAAGAAARRRDAIDAEAGRELIRRGRHAVAAGDIRQMVQADHEFHRFIYESSDNPLLIDSADRHWPHTCRTMAAHLAQVPSLELVWREHQAILDAIVAGDVRAAERLSRRHAEQSLRLILAGREAGHQATASPGPVKPARQSGRPKATTTTREAA